jgi:hypothetical protein
LQKIAFLNQQVESVAAWLWRLHKAHFIKQTILFDQLLKRHMRMDTGTVQTLQNAQFTLKNQPFFGA